MESCWIERCFCTKILSGWRLYVTAIDSARSTQYVSRPIQATQYTTPLHMHSMHGFSFRADQCFNQTLFRSDDFGSRWSWLSQWDIPYRVLGRHLISFGPLSSDCPSDAVLLFRKRISYSRDRWRLQAMHDPNLYFLVYYITSVMILLSARSLMVLMLAAAPLAGLTHCYKTHPLSARRPLPVEVPLHQLRCRMLRAAAPRP